jgi:hypothetical protein
MECSTKGIADDLEDITMLCINRGLQNGMVAISQCLPQVWMLLCDFGTAFDVRKEEGYSACR